MAGFESETYGRYLIKSGPLAKKWAANGFRGKICAAKATGDSRDAVVADIKQQLDQLDLADTQDQDDAGVPSSKRYQAAFEVLLPKLPPKYLAMLRAHLAAPDHLMTATQLAQSAQYTGYKSANLHYGKLGRRVAEELRYDLPRRGNGTPVWTCGIARDPSLDTETVAGAMVDELGQNAELADFQWQLRPQVVEALKILRI